MCPGPKYVSRPGPVRGRGGTGRWEWGEDTSEGMVTPSCSDGGRADVRALQQVCACDSHRRWGTPTVCQVLALGATASSTGRSGREVRSLGALGLATPLRGDVLPAEVPAEPPASPRRRQAHCTGEEPEVWKGPGPGPHSRRVGGLSPHGDSTAFRGLATQATVRTGSRAGAEGGGLA